MRPPSLRLFDITTYKKKSGTDPTRVPAQATIALYKQGATAQLGATLPIPIGPDPPPTLVTVYDTSEIKLLDLLQVNSDATKLARVGDVPDARTLSLVSAGNYSVTINPGDRLIRNGDRPIGYLDINGTLPVPNSNSIVTDSVTGRGYCYLREKQFDHITTIDGEATVFPDVEGTFVPTLTEVTNATQYASIKAALDALPPEGGTVVIPAGIYTLTSANAPLVLARPNTRIIGEGVGVTVLQCASPFAACVFQIAADNCTISNLTIRQQTPLTPGQTIGIDVGGTVAPVRHVTLRDLDIIATPSIGLRIGAGSNQPITFLLAENVRVRNSQATAQVSIGANSMLLLFRRCTIESVARADAPTVSPSGVRGITLLNSSSIQFESCTGVPAANAPWLEAPSGGLNIVLIGCKSTAGATPQTFLVSCANCIHLTIRDSTFIDGTKGISLSNCYHPALISTLMRNVGSQTNGDMLVLADCVAPALIANSYEAANGVRGGMSYTESGTTFGTFVQNAGGIRIPNRPSEPIQQLKPGLFYYSTDPPTLTQLRFRTATTWKHYPPA